MVRFHLFAGLERVGDGPAVCLCMPQASSKTGLPGGPDSGGVACMVARPKNSYAALDQRYFAACNFQGHSVARPATIEARIGRWSAPEYQIRNSTHSRSPRNSILQDNEKESFFFFTERVPTF